MIGTRNRCIHFFEGGIDDTLRQAAGAQAESGNGGQPCQGGGAARASRGESIYCLIIPHYCIIVDGCRTR